MERVRQSYNPGIVQHYEYEVKMSLTLSKKVSPLPKSYTDVKQLCLSRQKLPFAPVCRINLPEFCENILELERLKEITWLDAIYECSPSESNSQPWAKYHALQHRRQLDLSEINTILPLIREPVHKIETQYHCMSIIRHNNETKSSTDSC